MIEEYEKMNESDKLNYLAKLANMYYEQNMTQAQIADKLSTSRFKISKMLQEARAKKVVEITINEPHNRLYEIESILKQNFNLKDAIVLDNKMLPYEETINSLGKIGANYLDNVITENSIVGLSWGKTIFNVVELLKPNKKLPITAVQLIGSAAKDDPLIDSQELVRKVASAYGGKYKYLYAPMYIDNDYVRKALIQEPVLNDTLFLANKADIILTGIGTVDAVFSSSLWADYLMRINKSDFNLNKAVGCIFARLYDENGNEIDIDTNKKVVGIDLSAVHRAKYSIGVAAGKFKAEAILGALRGQYINVLITDDATATKVLSLAKLY